MTTINYLRRDYTVLETRAMSTGLYGRINISTSDKPAYVWRLMPPCTAIVLWRPTIEVPITKLGFYKPGSKGVPGVNLHMTTARVVLTLPEAA